MIARDDSRRVAKGPVAVVLIAAIRAYQLSLSFLLGRHCRHLPTCSDYAMDAIRRHGAWAGFWLGLFRVARCHPLGTHGFDPPPDAAPRHELRIWRYARYGRRA
jgi:uncharacterized protein